MTCFTHFSNTISLQTKGSLFHLCFRLKGSVSGEQASIEDEMGLGGAAVEDAEAEYIRKICESELVTGKILSHHFLNVFCLKKFFHY